MEKPKKKIVLYIVLAVGFLVIAAAVIIYLLLSNYEKISNLLISPTPTFTQTMTVTSTPVTPTLTSTPVPTSTSTPKPTATRTSTRTPTLFANTRMGQVVQSLYDDGIIHSLDGEYHLLDDFDMSWAQIDWYRWYRTDYSPNDFVIRVDATWESASSTANWFDTGCGFVFSEVDTDNLHAVFVNADGYVRPHKYKGGYYYDLKSGYYGRFDTPKDSAEITLIVEDQILTVMVNDEVVVQFSDASLTKGNLGLSLISGTNKGFGTRCEMVNIDYWEIDQLDGNKVRLDMAIYYQDELITVRSLEEKDILALSTAFAEQNWNKPVSLFQKYLYEQENLSHFAFVAEYLGEVAGYTTLLPYAYFGPFTGKYPEIVDLNVLIKFQRKGIGNKLLDVAEGIAASISSTVTLGVGLHSGYGQAQRIYVKRGYIPDGSGVWYGDKLLDPHADCRNDDDLGLYLSKDLTNS